jgi:hypothetical protein
MMEVSGGRIDNAHSTSEPAFVSRLEEVGGMPGGAQGPQALELPTFELPIEIERTGGRLFVPRARLVYVREHGAAPPETAQQLRWSLHDRLLPDELLIIFGKPLHWTGPRGPQPEHLPLVEDIFPVPLTLGRHRESVVSGRPRLDANLDVTSVAWHYGVVLLRGHDTPWVADGHLRIDLHSA